MKKLAFAAMLMLAGCTNSCMTASDCRFACQPWGVVKFQPGTTNDRAACECLQPNICTDKLPAAGTPNLPVEGK